MQLLSISLARVAAFLEIASFDPDGQFTPAEGFGLLTKSYGFTVTPSKLADLVS